MLLLNEEWEHRDIMIEELKRSEKQRVSVKVEWEDQFQQTSGEHIGMVVFMFGIEEGYGVLAYAKFDADIKIPIYAIKNVWRNVE